MSVKLHNRTEALASACTEQDSSLASGGINISHLMTTKIKWRLANRPTPTEVIDLVSNNLLSKEEAREILITLETDDDRDKVSLQEEIKFLRELVQKLSNNSRTEIIKTIEYIEKPYKRYNWYEPYVTYCTATTPGISYTGSGTTYLTTADNTVSTNTAASITYSASDSDDASDFTALKTF